MFAVGYSGLGAADYDDADDNGDDCRSSTSTSSNVSI